ncbi:hypothetical protein BGW80DRAFT_1562971 [Lactifluus volemus]|nr:hypothetical protein BGW80DRAFT_1562971 [Lactifluus volemus]
MRQPSTSTSQSCSDPQCEDDSEPDNAHSPLSARICRDSDCHTDDVFWLAERISDIWMSQLFPLLCYVFAEGPFGMFLKPPLIYWSPGVRSFSGHCFWRQASQTSPIPLLCMRELEEMDDVVQDDGDMDRQLSSHHKTWPRDSQCHALGGTAQTTDHPSSTHHGCSIFNLRPNQQPLTMLDLRYNRKASLTLDIQECTCDPTLTKPIPIFSSIFSEDASVQDKSPPEFCAPVANFPQRVTSFLSS